MGNRSIPVETKQAILEDAKKRILEGSTLAQIATDHGIGERTLDTWLHALGDEYRELREAWVDNLLMNAGEEIENSLAPVMLMSGEELKDQEGNKVERTDRERLARARELWKRATWYAERRDRQRYGVQVANINIINGVSMVDALASEAGELLEHVTKDS